MVDKIKIGKNDKISITKARDDDIGSNKISFKQNSSGFWYVNELAICCISIMDGLEIMESAINRANEILKDKNNGSKKE